MAFLGRESEADRQRAERVRLWFQARTPYAMASLALGLASSVDVITIVLGATLGVAAILCGIAGLRDLRRQPHLLGRRLCIAGILLGSLGLILSIAVWRWLVIHSMGIPAPLPAPV